MHTTRMGLMWLTMSLALAPVAAAGEETKKPADESPANDRPGEMITIAAGSFLMGNNGHEGFGGPEGGSRNTPYTSPPTK